MIIDFHAHAFPEKIAARALDTLSNNSGNLKPFTDGTKSGLVAHLDTASVDKAVVLNIATSEKQQSNVNDFAASINSDRLVSFGSVFPLADSAVEELYRIKELGLKGIKLHPEYQDFFVDDDKVLKVYETADKLGLITTFHAGLDLGFEPPYHCTPQRLANILHVFKSGLVVAAHFGGFAMWDDVETHLVGKNIYFDTAFCFSRMSHMQAIRILKNHGSDKILFGSDIPWSASDLEMRFVDSFNLNDDEKAMILGGNAKKLLKLI